MRSPKSLYSDRKNRPRFLLTFEVACTLGLEEIWPDGDAPEDPTVEDVYKAMGTDGDPPSGYLAYDVLQEWNLGEGTEIVVRSSKSPPSPDPTTGEKADE